MNQPLRYSRILVAIDFSKHSEAALQQAIWIGRIQGAKIVLAHALPDLRKVAHEASYKAKLDLLQGEGELFEREVREKSDSKMRQMILDLKADDLDIQFETLIGESSVELIHAVQAEAFDLVLAGTRGVSSWEKFLVGSTASRLIQKCPASVWIVKAKHVSPPKVVLAPVDFSPVSLKAVRQGLSIAQQANAMFHLLHVIDDVDITSSYVANANRKEINEAVEKRLYGVLESLQIDREQIRVHLSIGAPWQEVGRLAQQLGVDLIAMGTVGRGGIQGLLLGNTAEKVLRTSDCSILTVKPDDFVSPIQPVSWPLHPGKGSEFR
jgi:universal stress protein E